MNSLAIMQPYFFPYLGYFQLMAAVDRFVIYDDVAFIKNGWINRNRLLLNGQAHYFTIPLRGASPNRKIHEVQAQPQAVWRRKMERTFAQAYAGAPGLDLVMELLTVSLDGADDGQGIDEYARASLRAVHTLLGLTTDIVTSSRGYGNAQLSGPDRVIDICQREGAATYVNAIGGRTLYDASSFERHGMRLEFVHPQLGPYPQVGTSNFVSGLSILDLLAHLPVPEVCELTTQGELQP